MILKVLQQYGFEFSQVPLDISDAVQELKICTSDTLESDNQKLNLPI